MVFKYKFQTPDFRTVSVAVHYMVSTRVGQKTEDDSVTLFHEGQLRP